jgi:hypothetical protein
MSRQTNCFPTKDWLDKILVEILIGNRKNELDVIK